MDYIYSFFFFDKKKIFNILKSSGSNKSLSYESIILVDEFFASKNLYFTYSKDEVNQPIICNDNLLLISYDECY